MKKIDLTNRNTDLEKLFKRELKDVSQIVRDILSDVKENGDNAILKYTSKFDGLNLSEIQIWNRAELERYIKNFESELNKDQIEAIEVANRNVTWFAKQTMPKDWSRIGLDGQIVGEKFSPFNRVACYVPQGSFPLVSTVIHTCSIAKVCGVKEIVMVTSPTDKLNPAVAYAAFLSGVTEIVFAGGAQGIAGVAYGTESIKSVDFICGPGNAYVAEAKKQVFGSVGIDMVAGPSEVFVVADSSANPYEVACDLFAQAEHGSGYEMSVLLTDSDQLINDVEFEMTNLKKEIKDNPGFQKVWDEFLFLIKTNDLSQAIDVVNIYGPEHVEIQTQNANQDSKKIVNAGAIFIGRYSAEPLGDFVVGPSHVLPTNSTARFSSGLTANSFFKRNSIIEIDESTYEKLSNYSNTFAQMEGLTAHGLSSVARKENNV